MCECAAECRGNHLGLEMLRTDSTHQLLLHFCFSGLFQNDPTRDERSSTRGKMSLSVGPQLLGWEESVKIIWPVQPTQIGKPKPCLMGPSNHSSAVTSLLF